MRLKTKRTIEHRNRLCTITRSRKYLVLFTYLNSGIRSIYTVLYLVWSPSREPKLAGTASIKSKHPFVFHARSPLAMVMFYG